MATLNFFFSNLINLNQGFGGEKEEETGEEAQKSG
jgi:hypothetical protein